jgi:uncharacterized OsmC-like protein
MSITIDVLYEGGLHCVATHGPSGATLATDAPVDNQGRGESFSPTDLVATALGTCFLTIMAIVGERGGLDLGGTRVRVVKEMITAPVRRIGKLTVTIVVPAEKAARLSAADRAKVEAAARHCPVHQSLHPEIQIPVEFIYEA